ncbi:MAG: mandelate racemase/muconate lactonizing enzyme family protein [Deinococcota bacterium]
MKITDIKSYPALIGHRNQLLVKVETDEGIFGWGESGLSGRELAVAGAIQHYRDYLVGRDPMQLGANWQRLYRSQYFEGGRVLTAAISAIDIALHDLTAKALNVPVYQLLGGKQRDFIPCFATTLAQDGQTLLDHVGLLLEHNWQCIRITPMFDHGGDEQLFEPSESIGLTAKWVNAIREEHGSEFMLGIDYHHRLSVAEAASFCQRVAPGALDFLEEPIRDENPSAYAALRQMTPVPFAIGEELSSKWAFAPYLEQGLTNYARIDICNVGGFTEAMKVAALAETHYIDIMPHNPLGPICAMASIHLGTAVPNFAWQETRDAPTEGLVVSDPDVFPEMIQLEGDRYRVPDGPGLGILVDEEALQHKPYAEGKNAPMLRKRDGSLTNW